MRITTYGFTLLIAVVMSASTARADQEQQTEYRTVEPVKPLPQPNSAPRPEPEIRPKVEAKTPAPAKNNGGKASVGRERTAKGRLKLRIDADGELGLRDELYGKLERKNPAEARTPSPAAPAAKPSGTAVTAVPRTLTVVKPQVTTTDRRQEFLYYRVRRGDTLDRIARNLRASGLDVTTATLLHVNRDRLSSANAIRAGDTLRVPLRQHGSPRRSKLIPLK